MKPYQFTIENKSKETKKAILLGQAINLLKSNYGSDEEIIIKPTTDAKYLDLLLQTSSEVFHAKRITIFSTNILPESIKLGTLTNNRSIEIDEKTGTFTVGLKPAMNVDKNMSIEINMPPESDITVTLLP